ncbi:MATE family efflux transporter [Sporosalibacterium faouarense]|uniref:MATE family efflux transporter n=1 Tax=Sporosalibacterium faouarense TaxID=516123 RepID=UPI00192C1977|nr:MATE family efflux transporter [Sporosalibacterium faouarense]
MTEGNIGKTLRDLTIPMILGILGMVSFNLADTYFVGQLGTKQIAALTFTFPVVLVLNSLNLGIGIGASAVISKAVGEKNRDKVVRLATDSLTLGLIFAIIAMIIGELTIEPLFTLLGADQGTIPYITEYMSIWYAGVPFVVIPMIGNNAIRALGDTKTPSMVMMTSAGVNILLDPLLIFGVGLFPELGVSGAALATVFARALTFFVALYILIIREKVISLKVIKFKELIDSWKTILFIGMPNAVAKMVIPIGAGIITGLIANFGTEAVAGYGIATKLEYFAICIVNALSSVMPVYVGQNFGAKKIDRIKDGVTISEKFSIISGLVIYAILAIVARPLSYLFTDSKAVSDVIVTYLRIVPLGYTFQGVLLIINGALNALHKPFKAALVNISQMLILYVPLAIITSKYFGIKGIFTSLVASYITVGAISHFIIHKDISRIKRRLSA